ncbi:thiamine-phosphate kinase [Microbacterium sp.]|uniref:thiamine-phosphate kinase n=1 Tax=Microbacterium sp. TaxID=51671 RepID=UPI003A83D030
MSVTTVGELSEAEVLAVIMTGLKGSSSALVGPGDDAAVIAAPDGRVVASTDTLVHGPDFRLAWSSGYDLGFKAAAVNLADIAAMGARPTALLLALAMPTETSVSFVSDLAAGLRGGCDRLAPGCAVEGGDLTVSDTLTIAVTALGSLDGRDPVRRSGARPGDVVAVAGRLGSSVRGLDILFSRFRDADGTPAPVDLALLSPQERDDLAAHLRPEPPIAAGTAAAAAGANAMMDVSDGLLLDAARMADASGVTIDLDPPRDAVALRGGEDHALLATFPGAMPSAFRVIGTVCKRSAHAVTIAGQAPVDRAGWDPYRDWDRTAG